MPKNPGSSLVVSLSPDAPAPSRRDLLSVSRTQPRSFQRVDAITQVMDGVLWSVLDLHSGGLMVAGDDGAVFHFDGEAWSREALGTDLPVHALCQVPGGQVVGVGWMGVICERTDGVWRYVQGGHQISKDATPDAVRENLPLFAVAAAAAGDVWAVGDQGRVATRRDGIWQEIDAGTTANLRSVLTMPDGAVLIGGADGVLLKFFDDFWTTIETGTSCHITGLALMGSGEVVGVGGEYSSEQGGFLGRVFGIDPAEDGRCREIQTAQSLPRLRKVMPFGGGAVVVGDGGCAMLVGGTIDAPDVVKLDTGLRHDLHDVALFGGGSLTFCGDGGAVLLENKEAVSRLAALSTVDTEEVLPWQTVAQGVTDKTLRSVWAASDDDVFAVGDEGTVLKFDGKDWTQTQVMPAVRLHAVWGTASDNVYAAGDRGMVFQYNGGVWVKVYQAPLDLAFIAITGFGPHDIFAVGDEGLAVHFDGDSWSQIQTGTKSELYGVWGQDSEHVLAVGGAGTVVRWNGTQCDTFAAGTDNDVFGVWGRALDDIHLVGLSGTIIAFRDGRWEKEFSGSRADLNAITGRPDGLMVAVGTRGEILTRSGGKWLPEVSGCDCGLRAVSLAPRAVFAVGDSGTIVTRPLQ